MQQAIVPFRPRADLDDTTIGEIFAKSGFFSDATQAAQAVTKILAGRELGIGPLAAMTGIYLVKGHVTLSANLIASLIKRSGRYNYRVKRLDNEGCEIAFLENGEVIGESSFTRKDAEAAGLWGNAGPWKSYPRNMLYARAISNGAKWYCPDLFSGPIYTPEELGAAVDGDSGQPVVDLRTGEIIEAEVAEAREAKRPAALIKALADWHEEATRAQANGIAPAERHIDTATYEELRESSTRLFKLRAAAEGIGWPELVLRASVWDIPFDPLPEVCTPKQLRAAYEHLGLTLDSYLREHPELGPEADAADEDIPVPF